MAESLREVVEPEPEGGPAGSGSTTWSERGGWERAEVTLAQEVALTLFLDRVELATMMCTPEKLNFLVAGFLRSEGLIERLDDIAVMRVCDEERVADVRLMRPREVAGRRILTSGCGGGLTFDPGDALAPVSADLRVSPGAVLAGMKMLQQFGNESGGRDGMHRSALSDGQALLAVARDIGRHNTLDKIWGECLFREISTGGRMLLTTGRLSSEMLAKAAKMAVPVVASLNSPTDRTVQLARELGITVVGYARGGRLTVYCHQERLGMRP